MLYIRVYAISIVTIRSRTQVKNMKNMKSRFACLLFGLMLVLTAFSGFFMAIGPARADEDLLPLDEVVGGSLSGTGQSYKYYVTIDDGYESLTIQMDETTSGYDFDLYLRYQYWPTTSEYDVRGYTSPPSETCTIDNPAGGSYGIMVYSYSGGGGYTITATLGGGSSTTPPLTLGTPLTSQSLGATGAENLYKVDVSAAYASLTVKTYASSTGYDFDLYVKRDAVPTTSNYDVRGYTSSASETCTINTPATGMYYIMVHSYSGSGLYDISATAVGGGDTTAPTISSISATSITTSSATISWVTDEASNTIPLQGELHGFQHQQRPEH